MSDAAVRAGILVTGTEVLSGFITDRNGPWVSERLGELGVEVTQIALVGDRPEDLEAALGAMRDHGVDLIVTTGGLGPTADDLTAEVVGRFAGRELKLDEEMEAKIHAILEQFARRFSFDANALRDANRKQAMVPEGATAIDPAGTAPGLVVPAGDVVVIVLPGPPRELHRMWPQALAVPPAREVLDRAEPYESFSIRMFGVPESELAKALREIEQATDLGALEITTCLRGGELITDVRHRKGAEGAAEALKAGIEQRLGRWTYSESGETIGEVVAKRLDGRTLAVAESCTAGLLAGRLTERPGASEYFKGGVVAYSNEAKTDLLGVDAGLIERHGAVSPEVAEAMADGVLERLGADVACSVTGIAGPDGGTEEKPVGYVCFCVKSAKGELLPRDIVLPGDRADIRERSVVVAMHLLRYLLEARAAAMSRSIEAFDPKLDSLRTEKLFARLSSTDWPQQPDGGWSYGTDIGEARRVCDHWLRAAQRFRRKGYDLDRLRRLTELGSSRWNGIHFLRFGPGGGIPTVLLHGWPSGPIEYEAAGGLLAAAGHDVIVPSLPGFAWSEPPPEPLNVAGMSARLRELLETGLGLNRYLLAGGDWGGIIAARIAYDAPERVAGLYVSTPGVLPTPPNLENPPMSEDEVAYAQRAQRWLRREGHHILIQSVAPDAISPALSDSPAGLAAYLIEKYRRWSDSGGELERRFSLDEVCDFLTMFWWGDSIATSMRLYWAERRDRWRLAPGERIAVPAAISVFPGRSEGELGAGASEANTLATLNPPREWSERVLSELRSWNQMPSGGHFGAFEEPELYARDLLAFADSL